MSTDYTPQKHFFIRLWSDYFFFILNKSRKPLRTKTDKEEVSKNSVKFPQLKQEERIIK